MANGFKINPAWAAVILTTVVLFIGLIGGWYLLGERQNVHAREFVDVKKTIKANKTKCDQRIEEMQKQVIEQNKLIHQESIKQTERWTKVQTNIDWIKKDLEDKNGN